MFGTTQDREMRNATARILLVEDDERIRKELLDGLRGSGFDVDVSVLGRHARLALQRDYDLVLLDLGLPDGDGLDLCRELRARGRSVPVIILTARDAPEHRVRGLDVGADDYVVKPFHMPELIARVRSVLRRAGRTVGPGRAQFQDLWVDPQSRTARRGERVLDLTRREFDLLLFFLRFPGRTWTRDQLLDRVWGPTFGGDSRTVDLHVRRLRAKIEDDPGDPKYLATVWGVGYRMGEAS
jgi:two-component system response regulator MtrA